MENSKLTRTFNVLLKLAGIIALLYCIKFAFRIPVLSNVKKPEFDLSFTILLIIGIILFFFKTFQIGAISFSRWVKNLGIQKIKFSNLEIELIALQNVLKEDKMEIPEDEYKDGLRNLLNETCQRIDSKIKNLIDVYRVESHSQAIKNNPEKCAALLFTHDYLRPELLVTYLWLRKNRAEILRDPKNDSQVLMRTIGLSMSILTKLETHFA